MKIKNLLKLLSLSAILSITISAMEEEAGSTDIKAPATTCAMSGQEDIESSPNNTLVVALEQNDQGTFRNMLEGSSLSEKNISHVIFAGHDYKDDREDFFSIILDCAKTHTEGILGRLLPLATRNGYSRMFMRLMSMKPSIASIECALPHAIRRGQLYMVDSLLNARSSKKEDILYWNTPILLSIAINNLSGIKDPTFYENCIAIASRLLRCPQFSTQEGINDALVSVAGRNELATAVFLLESPVVRVKPDQNGINAARHAAIEHNRPGMASLLFEKFLIASYLLHCPQFSTQEGINDALVSELATAVFLLESPVVYIRPENVTFALMISLSLQADDVTIADRSLVFGIMPDQNGSNRALNIVALWNQGNIISTVEFLLKLPDDVRPGQTAVVSAYRTIESRRRGTIVRYDRVAARFVSAAILARLG